MKVKYLVGVDEAGRGPLAGPVSVGVVVVPIEYQPALKQYGVKDSKKLAEQDRERWYNWLAVERRAGRLNFATALVSSRFIDRRGIVPAVKMGISRCLRRLNLKPADCELRLDGSLRAPRAYRRQQTIIKGDEHEPIIALASIAAKVRRDRYMCRIAKTLPVYQFEIHKGYGTSRHYAALKKFGPSFIHRRSFL